MRSVPVVIIKGRESVPIGLHCPECDGQLYASLEAVESAAMAPAYCDKCDYEGFRHGGINVPFVEEFLYELKEEVQSNGQTT